MWQEWDKWSCIGLGLIIGVFIGVLWIGAGNWAMNVIQNPHEKPVNLTELTNQNYDKMSNYWWYKLNAVPSTLQLIETVQPTNKSYRCTWMVNDTDGKSHKIVVVNQDTQRTGSIMYDMMYIDGVKY